MSLLHRKKIIILLGILFFLTFSMHSFGAWYLGPSLNYARHALDVVEHDGNIYAIGGFDGGDRLEVLYLGSPNWTTLAPLPTEQKGLCAAVVGDKIYTFGSYGPSAICQIYDIPTNTWTTGPDVPVKLYWATAEAVGPRIYLIAGWSPGGGGGALKSLYILDTLSLQWTSGAPLPATIQIPASAVFGDYIYVFGNSGNYYKYDILLNSWSNFTGPPSGHGYSAEAVTVWDKIYLIGGNAGYIYEAYKTTEIYDPPSDTWATGPDLNQGRYQFGACFLQPENKIYAVAGRDENALSMRTVEILDVTFLPLTVDPTHLSVKGGSVDFSLSAGGKYPNRKYFLLGSVTGTVPGTTFPSGVVLPLNWDVFTRLCFTFANTPAMVDFHSTLNGTGQGKAQLNTLGPVNPIAVGTTMYFAYVLYSPVDFASNPVSVTWVP